MIEVFEINQYLEDYGSDKYKLQLTVFIINLNKNNWYVIKATQI